MSDSDMWVIEVKGPRGVGIVSVTDAEVKSYFGTNSYASAAWLAGWKLQETATNES